MREKLLSSDLWAARLERYSFYPLYRLRVDFVKLKIWSFTMLKILGTLFMGLCHCAVCGKKWMVVTGVGFVGI